MRIGSIRSGGEHKGSLRVSCCVSIALGIILKGFIETYKLHIFNEVIMYYENKT